MPAADSSALLAVNFASHPQPNRINRCPIDEELTEATCAVFAVCQRGMRAEAQNKLVQLLDAPTTR